MIHYTGQNLRDRSFRKRNLALTDFSGADIRGCDFSGAQLSGADFSNVKAGLSGRQKLILGFITLSVAAIVGDTISRLVFGTLGQSPVDLSNPHVPVLYVMLNLTGVNAAISALFHRSKLGRITLVLTGILSGAIVGFAIGYFYPNLILHLLNVVHNHQLPSSLKSLENALSFLANQQRMVSAQGAIVIGVVMLLLGRFQHKTSYKIVVSIAGCITIYGATFLWGSIAGAYLSTSNVLFIVLFSLLTLIFLALTTLCFFRIGYELQHAIGTSFYKADLTHAKFKYADLRNTDFSKTIGYFPPDLK